MPELEKVTVNLGPVDLGQIELLVEQGYYANRAEFIRAAIQSQLQRHGEAVQSAAARLDYVIGAVSYGRKMLQRRADKGEKLKIHVIGYLHLADDVTPKLALKVIESVKVRGIFRASGAVKDALAGRID